MSLKKLLALTVIVFAINSLKPVHAQSPGNNTPKTIVVLGSSTSYGYLASPVDSSFVGRLRINLRTYHRKDTIINLGFPGYTTYEIQPTGKIPTPDTGTIAQPDTARNITKALSYKPNLVIINMPTNDIDDNYTDTQSLNNYKTVVNMLVAAHIPYIITSTQPRDFTAAQRTRLRPFTNLLLSTFPTHVVDYLDQLSNPDYTIRDSLSGGDGIHVNNIGHKIIYNAIVNFPLYKQVVNFTQVISCNNFGPSVYGAADYVPGATSTSGLPLKYTSSNTNVATIVNGKIHVLTTGTSTITFTQAGNMNYAPALPITRILVVKPAVLTITTANQTRAYGVANPKFSLSYTGYLNGDTYLNLTQKPKATTAATAASPVGSYSITIANAADSNYAITYTPGNLMVTPAPLSIKANNETILRGTADPDLTVTYTGFVNGDDSTKLTTSPTISTTATSSSPVGHYPITVSGASSPNYNIGYIPGILTIKPAPPPSINSFAPTAAMTGTTVTISGSNFYDVTGVSFGGTPAASFTVVSPTSITAVIATGTSGKISVGTPSGTVLVDGFTYAYDLPASNFKLGITSVTCKGSADGSVNITAVQNLNYTATITGNGLNAQYPFTTASTINNLAAGTYSVCITVAGQPDYSQCFDAVITEPKDLSVYSFVNNSTGSINLNLAGGNQYNIMLNGVSYTTTDNSITLPLQAGNNDLSVTTDKLCQGTFQKLINSSGKITPYPIPFQNTLNLNLGNANVSNVSIEIHNVSDGKLVYAKQYVNRSGVLQFDLTTLNNGIYALHLSMDHSDKLFKIIKQ